MNLRTICLILLVAGASIFNSLRIFKDDHSAGSYSDFINPYIGATLWLDNKNPYDDQLLKIRWEQVKKEEHIPSSFIIGQPDGPFVYPIISIPFFSWVQFFPYTQCYRLWQYICIISLIVSYVYSLKIMDYYGVNSFIDRICFTGICLSIKFLYASIFLGQPALLAIAFALAGYYYFLKERTLLSGILFGLATIKITILFPFLLVILLFKRWKILCIVLGIMTILIAIFFMKDVSMQNMFIEYSKGIAVLNATIFNIPSGTLYTDLMTKSTELITITTYMVPAGFQYAIWIKIVFTLLLVALLYSSADFLKKEKPVLLLIISIWSLLIMYHIMYDCIILLPMYIVYAIYKLDTLEKISFIGFLILLILPVNGMLDKLHTGNDLLSLGYLHIPLALLFLIVVLVRFVRRRSILNHRFI